MIAEDTGVGQLLTGVTPGDFDVSLWCVGSVTWRVDCLRAGDDLIERFEGSSDTTVMSLVTARVTVPAGAEAVAVTLIGGLAPDGAPFTAVDLVALQPVQS